MTAYERAASPLQSLRAGVAVEVGGYELNPALTGGLEAAVFEVPSDFVGRIVWLELSAAGLPEVSPPPHGLSSGCVRAGIRIDAGLMAGTAF